MINTCRKLEDFKDNGQVNADIANLRFKHHLNRVRETLN